MSDFDFAIKNAQEFSEKLDELEKHISDFRVPFRLISSHFYKSQKRIFLLKSEGRYPPLGGFRPNTVEENGLTRRRNAEDRKERRNKRPWAPILYGATGDLKDSTLSNSHRYSIYFLGRQSLVIGTSVPYGKYHQSDGPRKKIPERKFIYIDGGKQDMAKDSNGQGRREVWLNIIDTHIKQLVEGQV